MGGLWLVDRTRTWARRRAWPGGLGGKRSLARWVAPAVFLLAVTGVVLAVRAGLSSDSAPTRTTPTVAVTTTARPRTRPSAPKRFYVIQSGDTLGAVAGHFGITLAALLRLNPGIEPTALIPGQRVRVG